MSDQQFKEYRVLLESLRVPHLILEGDCWFSCPKSGECCNDDKDKDHCDCGADAHNAKVDAAIAAAESFFSDTQSWRPMDTAPKNATWVALLTITNGRRIRYVAHFAEGGGEDQPRFGPGWFYDTGSMYAEVRGTPTHWMPLPEAPKEGTI